MRAAIWVSSPAASGVSVIRYSPGGEICVIVADPHKRTTIFVVTAQSQSDDSNLPRRSVKENRTVRFNLQHLRLKSAAVTARA